MDFPDIDHRALSLITPSLGAPSLLLIFVDHVRILLIRLRGGQNVVAIVVLVDVVILVGWLHRGEKAVGGLSILRKNSYGSFFFMLMLKQWRGPSIPCVGTDHAFVL